MTLREWIEVLGLAQMTVSYVKRSETWISMSTEIDRWNYQNATKPNEMNCSHTDRSSLEQFENLAILQEELETGVRCFSELPSHRLSFNNSIDDWFIHSLIDR